MEKDPRHTTLSNHKLARLSFNTCYNCYSEWRYLDKKSAGRTVGVEVGVPDPGGEGDD